VKLPPQEFTVQGGASLRDRALRDDERTERPLRLPRRPLFWQKAPDACGSKRQVIRILRLLIPLRPPMIAFLVVVDLKFPTSMQQASHRNFKSKKPH